MNRLIIIGASGHGKVIADIAKLNGYRDIVFADDNINIKKCLDYPIIGTTSMIEDLEGDVFIAIGDAKARRKIMERYSKRQFPVLIHPHAVVCEGTEIGMGSVVMAGVVINPSVKVGKGVIINTSSSVDHDCVIGDFVHIAVGAHICGTVNIEAETWIGAGATVINNINIHTKCVVGAGAVVVNSIIEEGVYYGVPAKKRNNSIALK